MTTVLVTIAAWWSLWWLAVDRPFPRRWPGPPASDHTLRSDRPARSSRSSDRPGPDGQIPAASLAGIRAASSTGIRAGSRSGGATGPAALAAAVDLLAVAVSSGLSLPTAVSAVGAAGTDPATRAFAAVAAALARGASFQRALDELELHAGVDARPLRATLGAAITSGAPVGDSLRRQADRLRRGHRRRLEQRIRRLPVLLLLPLCLFVLPAFVVVTIVPVAWTAAAQLQLDATGSP